MTREQQERLLSFFYIGDIHLPTNTYTHDRNVITNKPSYVEESIKKNTEKCLT